MTSNELHRRYSRLRGIFEETERCLPGQMEKIARLMKAGAELDERPLTAIRTRYERLMSTAEVIEMEIRAAAPDEDRLALLLDEAIRHGSSILVELRAFGATLDERLKALQRV